MLFYSTVVSKVIQLEKEASSLGCWALALPTLCIMSLQNGLCHCQSLGMPVVIKKKKITLDFTACPACPQPGSCLFCFFLLLL